MKKRTMLIVLSVLVMSAMVLTSCKPVSAPEPTQAPEIVETEAPAETEAPVATAEPTEAPVELGTEDNPIVLAFAPSMTSQQVAESGQALADKLMELTGYKIVTNIPTSYAALIEAMGSGNAHIALFPTFAYLVAHDKGYADVGLIVERYGSTFYGAQFVAAKSSGFTSYFDSETNTNTADAATALAQFADKKPCWTDPLSTSGYIIPYGILQNLGIPTKAGAFVQGHPTVITALNAGGICDFGATFIDVRTNPTLQEQIPDVMEKIDVIWRTDPVIPNDNISFATSMSPEMVQKFKDAFIQMSSTEDGKAILKAIYEFESVKECEDSFYDDFRVYIQAAGFDYTSAVK
ncbi:MAG: phosphate/phosphite/phosphonate ABC transporter substrate-binding protein [Anaerolineaceae bacterium]